jgi:hypothetical protein
MMAALVFGDLVIPGLRLLFEYSLLPLPSLHSLQIMLRRTVIPPFYYGSVLLPSICRNKPSTA